MDNPNDLAKKVLDDLKAAAESPNAKKRVVQSSDSYFGSHQSKSEHWYL